MKNKKHWYDGWFYDIIIAPNQEGVFSRIREIIREGSDVIDIGCGTGRLAFSLAPECRSVLGIDLSERNIRRAGENLLKQPYENIIFRHSGLTETLAEEKRHFDYAILSFVIHEVDKEARPELLMEALSAAEKIIVCDHLPETRPLTSLAREAIEFLAGIKHYRNFRNFVASGGITAIAKEIGLKIVHEEVFKGTLHVVIFSR